MADTNNIPTLEDINEGIAKFLAIEESDPKFACFIANGILSTLLSEYVEPQKATIEAQEAEIKRLRGMLEYAHEIFKAYADSSYSFNNCATVGEDAAGVIEAALKGE